MDAELTVRAICRALVLPPGGLVLVGFLGLALLKRWPRLGRALVATAFGLLLLLSLPLIDGALTRAAECCAPLDATRLPPADVIVVLGGGVTPGAVGFLPSASTLERLDYAAQLGRLTGLPLFLSGGAVQGREPEAEVMARTLKGDFGLEARWLETRSRTTEENATMSAPLLRSLGLTRVLLVTSAVHMRRSRAEFRAAGIEAIPAPTRASGPSPAGVRAWLPSAESLVRSHAALYELAGELVARVSGRR